MNKEEIDEDELTLTLTGPAIPPGDEIDRPAVLGVKFSDCARAVSG
jgi:hypothetical protein